MVNLKKSNFRWNEGRCRYGSVGWSVSHRLKGHGLNSQTGHISRLRVRCWVRVRARRPPIKVSLSLFPSFPSPTPLALSKSNGEILSGEDKKIKEGTRKKYPNCSYWTSFDASNVTVKLSLFTAFWSTFLKKQPDMVESVQAWRSRCPFHIPILQLVRCVILHKSLSYSAYSLSSTAARDQSRAKRLWQVSHKFKMLYFIFFANQFTWQ